MMGLSVFISLPPACRLRCRGLWAYYALTSAMLSLPIASMTLLLNTQLGLASRPERVTAYYQATFATTVLRPLLGLLSDRAHSRRSLLALASACAGAATCALGALVDSLPSLFSMGVLAALAFCAAETAADGALIEAATGDATLVAQLQVAAMFVRSAGSAAASVLGALLLRFATPRVVICLAGCFGLAAAAVVMARFEAGAQQRRLAPEWSSPRRIVAVLRRRALPALLLFSLAACPSATDAYTSYISVTMAPQLLGIATAAETLCALGGTLWYGAAAGRHSTRVLLATGVTAAACVSVLRAAAPLGSITSPAYIVLVAALSGAASRLAFMPVLVLSAQLAPSGAEAACFAALITINDVGALVGSGLTQALTAAMRVGQPPDRSWRQLPLFVLVCALASLAPLLLLPCVQQLVEADAPPAAHNDGADFTEDASVPLLESPGELDAGREGTAEGE
jgi:MFS family permease